MTKLAIIRIRGNVNREQGVEDTMAMLRLYRRNYCVVLESTPSLLGMLDRVKDFVTWGEIDEATVKLLPAAEKTGNFFRLHPPRGGFERKGIKQAFARGGALGNRGAKICELVRRMIP